MRQRTVAKSILLISDDPAGRGGTEYGLLQTALGLRPRTLAPKGRSSQREARCIRCVLKPESRPEF